MKYRISYLPLADSDLLEIAEALSKYPGKAKRLFKEIERKTKSLEDLPYLWPGYPHRPEYRRMVLEDHLLFYTVDENENTVKIYRVLYDRRNIPEDFSFAGETGLSEIIK